jgi:5-methylcytosine-specific restriction endonuclease McrA
VSRTCSQCGEEKAEADFYRRSNGNIRNDCKACFIVRKKANYAAKAPEKRANQRAYYAENREYQLEWARKHGPDSYSDNRDKRKAKHRAYRDEIKLLPPDHPKKVRLAEIRKERFRRRRERELAAPGDGVSSEEWSALLNKYHHSCAYCFSKKNLGRDHVVPIVLGGADDASNVVPCCRDCNSSKGSKTVLRWIAMLERRLERAMSRQKVAA